MNSKKTSIEDSSIRVHEVHVSNTRVSLRASKSFVSLVRSKMIHGEAFAGIEDIDDVGNGWYHLVPSGMTKSGNILSQTDRALIAVFARDDIQSLVQELLENEARAETFKASSCGRNRVVIQLVGKASSAQRDKRNPAQKIASRGDRKSTRLNSSHRL